MDSKSMKILNKTKGVSLKQSCSSFFKQHFKSFIILNLDNCYRIDIHIAQNIKTLITFTNQNLCGTMPFLFKYQRHIVVKFQRENMKNNLIILKLCILESNCMLSLYFCLKNKYYLIFLIFTYTIFGRKIIVTISIDIR